jgi:hypothetical protein
MARATGHVVDLCGRSNWRATEANAFGAFLLVDVRVIDHVSVSGRATLSMAATGLMQRSGAVHRTASLRPDGRCFFVAPAFASSLDAADMHGRALHGGHRSGRALRAQQSFEC